MKYILRYGNNTIPYRIVRSKRRKTSEILVDESEIEVRTPAHKKDSEIQDILDDKKRWIFKKQLELKERIRHKQPEVLKSSYVEGRVRKLSTMIDVKPSKTVIKPLKSRWGSATEKGTINLNSSLLSAPKEVVDYVIVHELCHLKIRGHSRRYWELVGRHMPDYERHKKWLDTHRISTLVQDR